MPMLSAIFGAISGLGKIVGAIWGAFKLNFVYQAGKDAAARKALEEKVESQNVYAKIARRAPLDRAALLARMRERNRRS